MVGKYLKKGDIVVYESSVYPGATEELCIPLLEKTSYLVCGKDFGVGYSPERINPADKEHNLANIPKLISASDKSTLDIMARVYNSIVKAGAYKLSSIGAAEATKVVENIQRDLNISFMNEVALLLHHLDMDSVEVFKAMRTKWNCLPFKPGLVGGHCIPVNSYYLAHKAEERGFHPEVILAGRHLNEKMPKYIVENTIKKLIHIGKPIKGAKVALFGLSYKENTPDVHDTPTIDILKELKSYDVNLLVHDPQADISSAKKVHGIELCKWEDLTDLDAIIVIVAHDQFVNMDKAKLKKCFKDKGLIIDIKGICDPSEFENSDITLWRL
jgi:UDP-N-acetyl-D-galactosamine dehydrogenase